MLKLGKSQATAQNSFLIFAPSKLAKAAQQSLSIVLVALVAKLYFKPYAPPLMGLAVSHLLLRFVCTVFLHSHSLIERCKAIEKRYWFINPAILLITTFYFSPQLAGYPLTKNATFWIGLMCGALPGVTFSTKRKKL